MITFNNVKVFQVLDSAEGKEFYSYTDSNIDFVVTDNFLEQLKNNSEYGDSDSEITALMNKYFAEASPLCSLDSICRNSGKLQLS